MARYLGDINARARGLRTHLLPDTELERLASAHTLPDLQEQLKRLGFLQADVPATPSTLDRAIRRHAAGQMALLDRWCSEDRRDALVVIVDDEDRRSIHAILRGAQQGMGSEARMSGLVPTTNLNEGALKTLSSQPTPTDVVRKLVLWDHPFGAPLVGAVSGSNPSLFGIEIELERAFARRASAHARQGGSQMVEYVEQVIDVMNAWSVLCHFAERVPSIADLAFVDGGRWLTRDVFETLLSFDTIRDVEKRIAWELRRSALVDAFRESSGDLAKLESAVLQAQIAGMNRLMRIDPGGSAPLIGFALELRAQALNLRRIIWGVALRAPAALIQAEWVVA